MTSRPRVPVSCARPDECRRLATAGPLRVLRLVRGGGARAGLVEEVPELAKDRRERWWRHVPLSLSWSLADVRGDPVGEAVAVAAETSTSSTTSGGSAAGSPRATARTRTTRPGPGPRSRRTRGCGPQPRSYTSSARRSTRSWSSSTPRTASRHPDGSPASSSPTVSPASRDRGAPLPPRPARPRLGGDLRGLAGRRRRLVRGVRLDRGHDHRPGDGGAGDRRRHHPACAHRPVRRRTGRPLRRAPRRRARQRGPDRSAGRRHAAGHRRRDHRAAAAGRRDRVRCPRRDPQPGRDDPAPHARPHRRSPGGGRADAGGRPAGPLRQVRRSAVSWSLSAGSGW